MIHVLSLGHRALNRRVAVSLFLAGVLTCVPALHRANALPAPVNTDYELIWEDDFTSSTLDPTKWTINEGVRRDAINVPEAVSITSNNLVITTYTAGGLHYSGFVATADKFQHDYGYYEARINFNDEPGMWSAFWLMTPTIAVPMGQPNLAGVEMDIVEHRKIKQNGTNIENVVHCALHWDGYGANHQNDHPDDEIVTDLTQGTYHKYGLLWTPTTLTFYYDDTLIWTTSTAVSHRTEHIIFSSEIFGGGWAGNIPSGGYGSLANSSVKMKVDYVRVYNLKPSSSGQSAFAAHSLPGAIQAEDFDNGAQHVAYFDIANSGPGNNTTYRPGASVDISNATSAQGGKHVTSATRPERLEFTLDPTNSTDGLYTASFRVANGGTASSKVSLDVDGNLLGQSLAPLTGGWSTWQSYSVPGLLTLDGGDPLVFRVQFESPETMNLDALEFAYLGNVAEILEGEDATLSGGVVVNGSNFASGGEMLGSFNGSTAKAVWTGVDGFDGGTATLTIRYAGKGGTPVKALYVNGALVANQAFDISGDWHTFRNLTTQVTLNAGPVNTIEIRNGGIDSRSMNVDYAIVSKTVATGPEAETATLAGGTYTGSAFGASGGLVVKGIEVEDSSMTLTGVSGSGGSVNLAIRYSRGGSTPAAKSLFLNGSFVAQVTFPGTGTWTTFQEVTVPVTLNSGSSNTLMIKNDGANDDNKGVFIDSITLP